MAHRLQCGIEQILTGGSIFFMLTETNTGPERIFKLTGFAQNLI
jgi:hypothetical protein